jgi:capsular exopolysaccharide synthesis family protein
MAGQRVVLIDADLRRPHVHDMFERDLEPGLSNVLVGTTPAADAAIETEVDGLWVLPAGHIPPNPADLVGSVRFQDLMVGLRASADWIVIDSPPVLAVTDAAVLANTATGVIFVVGNEMTTQTAAAAAVDQLRRANAKFIGAVLNRVNIHRHAYYYAAYYRRKDEKYYVQSTKQPSTARGA